MVSEENVKNVSSVTEKEQNLVYWYSSANYGATVMRLVTRPSWRTVPGPTLAAGLARPELCRERRSHACGRPLALLLGVPGLFTAAPGLVAAPTALLLGALSLFHAAPAEAQVNAPTVQVASGNRKLTATFNTGGHPSTQVLRYRTRWRVKDTNPKGLMQDSAQAKPSPTPALTQSHMIYPWYLFIYF